MSGLKRSLEIVTEEGSSDLLRVAFASSDQTTVDQHFGSTEQLVLYGVNPERQRLLSIAQFEALTSDENEARLAQKLAVLEGCIAVYSRACGASAVRRLLDVGVQPVKVVEGATIVELLHALQAELASGPSAWLARAVQNNTLNYSSFNNLQANNSDE